MRTFLVMLCAFLSVLLASCNSQAESTPRLRPSEPVLSLEDADAGTSSTSLPRPDSLFDSWPWDDLPPQTPSTRDDLPDASAEPLGRGGGFLNWMEPTVRWLAPNTCSDRPLRLSPEVLGWARDGYLLWHICYETPSATSSQHPFALRRPTQTALTFFHEPSQTSRDILHIFAPRGTAPWTVNALVVLPPNTRPLLNLENRYANGDHLYAIQPLRWNEDIEIHGTLQLWRVHPDGMQALSVPGILCMYVSPRDIVTGRTFFLMPHTACPDGVESCRLSAYECTDLFGSPL